MTKRFKGYIIVLTEPITPLNNADQGGSFFLFKGNAKMDPKKDKSKVKPPKTYKEQVALYKSRNLYIEDSDIDSKES